MGRLLLIADSSVLIFMARVGRLDILKVLFTKIEVPSAVHEEVFAHGPHGHEVDSVRHAFGEGWMSTRDAPGKRIGALTERFPALDLGEAACLALALHLKQDKLLLDDGHARRAALLLGIRPMGTLGILAEAYRRGLIQSREEVAATLRALLAAGLWVSSEIVEGFWDRIGGRP